MEEVGCGADRPVNLGNRALLGTAAAVDLGFQLDVRFDRVDDLVCRRGRKWDRGNDGVQGDANTVSRALSLCRSSQLLPPPCPAAHRLFEATLLDHNDGRRPLI